MKNEILKRMLNFEELAEYIGLRPQTIKKVFSKVLWDKKDVDKYLERLPKIDC
jgi:ribosome-binding protein aMBF1 (putative translation factor)